jgi:hypothetical protein
LITSSPPSATKENMLLRAGGSIFVSLGFSGYLFELPSIDLSLYMLFDFAFVLAEYYEYLSFLKNGVPFE